MNETFQKKLEINFDIFIPHAVQARGWGMWFAQFKSRNVADIMVFVPSLFILNPHLRPP